MAYFLVELVSLNKKNGVGAHLVEAADATRAKELCQGVFAGDGDWSAATTTQITGAFAPDLAGWRYRVRVSLASGGEPDLVDVSYTAVGSDTNDLVGAALVTALNATTPIANSAYVAGTDTLTVAGAGDTLGDRTLRVETYAPGSDLPLPNSPLVSTIVHQGAAGAALTVVLPQPSPIPVVIRSFK